MSLGRRPPVASPVPLGGFARAVGTALLPAHRERTAAAIHAWLRVRFGGHTALLLDSGTTALTLAIVSAVEATGRRRVALPAFGCFDLATACDAAGVEVVLYDLDPVTLGPLWESLARAVDRKTAAVVVAHLYGIPVDLARVRAQTGPAGAVLIEDAAQGVGGSLDERALGGHGDLAILSFGRGKGLTAGGGGALLCHADWLVDRVAAAGHDLRRSGGGLTGLAVSLLQWGLGRPGWYWLPSGLPFLGLGETPYHAPSPPGGLAGAGHGLLSAAIEAEPLASDRRRATAAALRNALCETADLGIPGVPAGGTAGYLRFPVVAGPMLAERLRGSAAREEGILPGYPLALPDLPGFRERVLSGFGDYSGARRLASGLFTLPTHQWARIARLASVVRGP